jgi:chitin disaccharide deacetylase
VFGTVGRVHKMQNFLIVTADDFGLHHAVNDAVEQASRAGVLTSASLMVAAPAAADAVRRARELPQLRVGLHLVLTDGHAMLAPDLIPALADAAGCMNNFMFTAAVRFAVRPAVRRQLQAEIRAQFVEFARTGLPLDHVNVHKHFHLHPIVLELLLRIGMEFGVRAVRVPDEPIWFAAADGAWLSGVSSVLLAPWIIRMKRRLRSAGVLYNDHIFGIAASGAMNEAKMLQIVTRLPPGVTEIYLHPASESGEVIAAPMRRYRHADELAALLSPRVRSAIASAAVSSGGFADLVRMRRQTHDEKSNSYRSSRA